MKLFFICLTMITILSANAQSTGICFQSGEEQIALLELYTSEGCSSCPPAEAWLSGLKSSPRLWKDFAPLAFHVDYWDYLGWRDQWSAEKFSDRQRTYARQWGNDNIYTPGFVLNGQEWRNWSALKDGSLAVRKPAGVLTVNSTDTNHWAVRFVPAKVGAGPYTIHAALLAGGLTSNVKAGENRGRRLDHDFVVLGVTEGALTLRKGVAEGEFSIDRYIGDATVELALTAWVTQVGQLEPIQAAGGWLRIKASAPD